MAKYAVISHGAGFKAEVVVRLNADDRPIPVYQLVASFEDREDAMQYAKQKEGESA